MVLTKITTGVITDNTITTSDIATGTIVSADIADGTITSGDMALDPRNASNLSSGDVPLAQLGNAPETDLSGLEADIALLAFKTQANGNLSRYNLVDQSVDAFEDATGVDASASTGETRNSAGKYYSGLAGPTASGGTESIDGIYTIHTFSQAQSGTNYVNDTAQTTDYLIVAGGGGGGGFVGAGGGAGGYRSFTSVAIPAGTFGVVVGAGGAGGPGSNPGTIGTSGGASSFNSQTSAGGGGGGTYNSGNGAAGGSGGGGGGTGGSGGAGNTPSTSPSQGFPGGNGGGTDCRGGGGGGAGGTGAVSTVGNGGVGGVGVQNAITGVNLYYAGGGGGGSDSLVKAGGLGGGGAGGTEVGPGIAPVAGTDGLGGGGGGSRPRSTVSNEAGADGGDGIVIIRRPTAQTFNNMTLESITTTTATAPTKGDLVFTYTNGVGTAVLGTNITAEYSADAGSTWTNFGIAAGDVQGTTGGHTIVTKNDVALTSSSGTNMRYRIKTLVQSASLTTRIHAVSLGWS